MASRLENHKSVRAPGFYRSLLLQGLLVSLCASMACTILWGLLYYQPSLYELGGRIGLSGIFLTTGFWHLCFLAGAAWVFFNVKRTVRSNPFLRSITFLLLPTTLLTILMLDPATKEVFCFPQGGPLLFHCSGDLPAVVSTNDWLMQVVTGSLLPARFRFATASTVATALSRVFSIKRAAG